MPALTRPHPAAAATPPPPRNAVQTDGRAPLAVGIDYRPALLARSGIARAVRELCRALDRDASADTIDLRRFGHSLARCRVAPDRRRGLARLPIPGRSLPFLRRLGLGADRLCGRGGCAVFHWTDYVYPPLASARTRAVVTVHDVSFAAEESFHGPTQSAILRARCSAAVERAVRVIVPTHATAAGVHETLGVASERIEVVPFGADHLLPTDEPKGAHPRGGRPFVLAVGTVEPRKNHARLLEAWRALGEPRPDLVLIGRAGWETADFLNRLHEFDRDEPRFTWLERATDADLRTHLTHASAFAYPSRLEGFGFPPLEACAHGIPTLVGDTPALREVGGNAVTYCDPTSVESVRDGLRRILDDRDLREHLSKSGPTRALAFRWDECATQHARVYEEARSA